MSLGNNERASESAALMFDYGCSSVWMRRFIKTGARFDAVPWARKVEYHHEPLVRNLSLTSTFENSLPFLRVDP